jgi:hypothetical protein
MAIATVRGEPKSISADRSARRRPISCAGVGGFTTTRLAWDRDTRHRRDARRLKGR